MTMRNIFIIYVVKLHEFLKLVVKDRSLSHSTKQSFSCGFTGVWLFKLWCLDSNLDVHKYVFNGNLVRPSM